MEEYKGKPTGLDGVELPVKMQNLEKAVRRTLENHPYTRNSDVALTIRLIYDHYPQLMVKGTEKSKLKTGRTIEQWYIDVRALYIIREDNVKRVRAKIQNELHEFLPTEEAVRKQRKVSEEVWRHYCQFNPQSENDI